MGATVSVAGRAEFEERLARIERKRLERPGAGHLVRSQPRSPGSAAGPVARQANRRGLLPLRLVVLCIAPVLGAACAVGGNASAYHLVSGGMLEAMPHLDRLAPFADLILAALLLGIVLSLLGTRRGPRPTLVLLGFCAAMSGESLLAERFPGLWGRVYTPQHAERMAAAPEFPEGALRWALDAATPPASAAPFEISARPDL